MGGWRARDIPDLSGRYAVVTGANSGLGFHTALELARHGAEVVLAARSRGKGERAVLRIQWQVPGARVVLRRLDLADLESVREFAERVDRPLDLLVNNAGVMAIPPRQTHDHFEMQLGVNHLGHFALTGLLLPRLLERPGARVVTVSSGAHRIGRIDFADLMSERSYQPWAAYGRSKLANLLFMRELDRRARAAGLDLVSVAAHPGFASTNLQYVGPRMARRRLTGAAMHVATHTLGQSAARGALPQLYAATAPDVVGGEFFGPRGLAEQRGLPTRVSMSALARDDVLAELLWEESERLTRVRFPALSRRTIDLRASERSRTARE